MKIRTTSGFMLLELSFVFVFLTLTVFLAVTPLIFMQKRLAYAEIEALYARLCYLQARAIATNSTIEVFFEEDTDRYYIDKVACSLHAQAHFSIIDNLMGPPSKPTAQIINPINFPQRKLFLYPDGTMQAGTIYLTDRDKKNLYALTIPIGKSCIRKYRYDIFTRKWMLLA